MGPCGLGLGRSAGSCLLADWGGASAGSSSLVASATSVSTSRFGTEWALQKKQRNVSRTVVVTTEVRQITELLCYLSWTLASVNQFFDFIVHGQQRTWPSGHSNTEKKQSNEHGILISEILFDSGSSSVFQTKSLQEQEKLFCTWLQTTTFSKAVRRCWFLNQKTVLSRSNSYTIWTSCSKTHQ